MGWDMDVTGSVGGNFTLSGSVPFTKRGVTPLRINQYISPTPNLTNFLPGKVPRACVKQLLDSGADIRITNNRGKTPTQLVYGEKCKKLRDTLLRYSDQRMKEEEGSSSWKTMFRQQCNNVYDIMSNMEKMTLTGSLRDPDVSKS